jgi:hypothetical protein
MQSDSALVRFAAQLTIAHQLLNERLFRGELPPIKVSIEHKKRSDSNNILARYVSSSDNKSLYNSDHSIIIIHTIALDGNYFEIINTLVHEMVHQYGEEVLHKPTSYRTNVRHNTTFRDIGIMVGWIYKKTSELEDFEVSDRRRNGFSHPNDYTTAYKDTLNNLGIDHEIITSTIHHDAQDRGFKKRGGIKPKFYIFTCRCNTILKTEVPTVKALCMRCNSKFTLI